MNSNSSTESKMNKLNNGTSTFINHWAKQHNKKWEGKKRPNIRNRSKKTNAIKDRVVILTHADYSV